MMYNRTIMTKAQTVVAAEECHHKAPEEAHTVATTEAPAISRAPKPALTTHAAAEYLLSTGYKGGRVLNREQVKRVRRGSVVKHFWPTHSNVIKALDEALIKLECQGEVVLPARVTLDELKGSIRPHFELMLACEDYPDRGRALDKYRKPWKSLGGDLDDLKSTVDNELMHLCVWPKLISRARALLTSLAENRGAAAAAEEYQAAQICETVQAQAIPRSEPPAAGV